MFFLIRFVLSFVAALVVFLVSFFVTGMIFEDRAGCLLLLPLAAAAGTFIWTSRRLSRGRWARPHTEREIRKLKQQAIDARIAPQAYKVAHVLGGGTYAAGALRLSATTDSVSVDAAEGGAWRTVFAARFHPEVAGQVVPDRIREHPVLEGQEVLTKRVGHEPARWEVLAYLPGDWEKELRRLAKEAEHVEHEREKGRFGLE